MSNPRPPLAFAPESDLQASASQAENRVLRDLAFTLILNLALIAARAVRRRQSPAPNGQAVGRPGRDERQKLDRSETRRFDIGP